MNEKLSLTELQFIIKDSLYLALPDMYWVIAEISEIKENYNGHCYLELVEKLPDEINIRSRVKAVIWSSRYRFIKSFFENASGESLRVGLKILIRVKIEYHEIYGLSLVINDIDPAFTIGEMALRRQQILKKLEEEGVLTMNRELDFPVVPQRIAIISSSNAAGYTDFMKHLKGNSFGYVFYSALFESPMQGIETESGIINSLDRIASHIDKFDLVVIIRGGGSQIDLSWFDNYNIAFYVTQFPLPVITGIGHEKDLSVTDIVAHRSLKTPTAVADFIIGCMNDTDNHIIDLTNEIVDRSMLMLTESKTKIETARSRLVPVAKAQLISNRTVLIRSKEFLANALKNRLKIINNQLIGFGNSLKILDPENVLKRGYTITSLNGKILKKCKQVKKEDILETKFIDGSVSSKVFGV
jgi:exodeoxyribonuclease VII large subunit